MSERTDLMKKVQELRDLVNESVVPRSKVWRERNMGNWSKLWSAMDNLVDSQKAIDAFLSQHCGMLGIYGLLQAMSVQQDAVMHIEQALGLNISKFDNYPRLQEIRIVRDEVAGHPTSTRRARKHSKYEDGTLTYTSVSVQSQYSSILEYIVWTKDNSETKRIDLKKAIKDQDLLLSSIIEKAIYSIEQIESKHMKKFTNKSLYKTLGDTSYLVSKLFSFEKTRAVSEAAHETLRKELSNYKSGLIERYSEDALTNTLILPGMVYELDKCDELMKRIGENLLLDSTEIDYFTFDIYVEALSHSLKDLKSMAKDIDVSFGYQSESDKS